MIDLHCHILPCIDDGPNTVEKSVALVKMELNDGVDTIAVTPHFISRKESSVDDFCRKRRHSINLMKESLRSESIDINVIEAAEVALSMDLPDLNGIEQLKYAGTDYMLVELPSGYYYDWIPQTLYNLQLLGITPVLAHVERYSYLIKDSKNLYDLVNAGCVAQMNASFLLRSDFFTLKRIHRLVERDLIHLIVTDSHSVEHRPPKLKAAMTLAAKKWGNSAKSYFCENAKNIIENEELIIQPMSK